MNCNIHNKRLFIAKNKKKNKKKKQKKKTKNKKKKHPHKHIWQEIMTFDRIYLYHDYIINKL